jgi:hypothetical protein
MNHTQFSIESSKLLSQFLYLIVGVVLALAASVGIWRDRVWPASTSGVAELYVAVEDLDFGEVWSQRHFEWTLPISNMSHQEIAIAGFRSSCGCTDISPREGLTVPPFERRNVVVQMDLSAANGLPNHGLIRNVSVDVIPVSAKRGERSPVWTISGRVKVALEVLPDHITLDGADQLIEGMSPPTQKLVVNELLPLGSIRAECDPDIGTAAIESEENGRHSLHFAPRSDGPVGEFSGLISLYPVSPTGDDLPPVEVAVSGRKRSDIHVIPSRLYCHEYGPGIHSLVVQAYSGRAFYLNEVSFTDNRVNLTEGYSWGQKAAAHCLMVDTSGLTREAQSVAEATIQISVMDVEGAIHSVEVPIVVDKYAR